MHLKQSRHAREALRCGKRISRFTGPGTAIFGVGERAPAGAAGRDGF